MAGSEAVDDGETRSEKMDGYVGRTDGRRGCLYEMGMMGLEETGGRTKSEGSWKAISMHQLTGAHRCFLQTGGQQSPQFIRASILYPAKSRTRPAQ